jgi:type IV pilus assembly protein PilW
MKPRTRTQGLTLIELMIAMVISSIVVAGTLSLYAQVHDTWQANERVARMQEQGRVALSVIEPDVELAGYYGFSNAAESVRFVRGANPGHVLATAAQMRQFPAAAGDPLPSPLVALPAGAHTCGVNFAVDIALPVQGSNDVFALGRAATCAPYRNRAQPGADTLTLRRAETQTTDAEAGRVQIYASRLASRTGQLMFADGHSPGPVDGNHGIHNLMVRTYYVARDSVGQNDFPALRVKTMTRSGAGVFFDDDEVMPGIEDLQVQFGIDTGGEPGSGQSTRYVNPDFPDLPGAHVVAVRIWLRVRSDEPEGNLDDTHTYRYGDVVFTPAGVERKYRRVLVSRTVAVRNARWG